LPSSTGTGSTSDPYKETTMHKIRLAVSALLLTLISGYSTADTLQLVDGTLLEGDFVGSSNGIIMFNIGDSIEAYPENQVAGIFLGDDGGAAQPPAERRGTTVPVGTRLVIRMADTIDSRRHNVGHKFRGQLEGALVVNGVTVAPRGTILYGTISAAQQSGRAVGASTLAMEFTDIMINDQLYPIATQGLSAQTGGEGRRTVGRTARAAALGGLIDGSSGARTGAKVGLGASILTSGQSINVPAGTLLETALRVPLDIE
jgi:hypothetical protein